jgi:hypothetical protein
MATPVDSGKITAVTQAKEGKVRTVDIGELMTSLVEDRRGKPIAGTPFYVTYLVID